jgi:hypothetical protein
MCLPPYKYTEKRREDPSARDQLETHPIGNSMITNFGLFMECHMQDITAHQVQHQPQVGDVLPGVRSHRRYLLRELGCHGVQQRNGLWRHSLG